MALAALSVSVPASDWIVVAPVNVAVPPQILLPLTLRSAPLDDTPVPVSERGSAPTGILFCSSSAAPVPDTVTPPPVDPVAVLFRILRVPALMVVGPM